MSENDIAASAFYKQFNEVNTYLIAYPSNDYDLPDWDGEGNLIEHEETEWTTSKIEAVHLGERRYRLAAKLDAPFSFWKLEWGEEFLADAGLAGGSSLILRSVVMPPKYVHEISSCILEPGGWRESNESRLIHDLDGGWEYALGVLTISIPIRKYSTYLERLEIFKNEGSSFRRVLL